MTAQLLCPRNFAVLLPHLASYPFLSLKADECLASALSRRAGKFLSSDPRSPHSNFCRGAYIAGDPEGVERGQGVGVSRLCRGHPVASGPPLLGRVVDSCLVGQAERETQ